jgi:hypothetical protein
MIRYDSEAMFIDLLSEYMTAMRDVIDQAERNAQHNCPDMELRPTIEAGIASLGHILWGWVQSGSPEAYWSIYPEKGTGIYAEGPKPADFNPRRAGYPSPIVPRGRGNKWQDLGGHWHPGADILSWTDSSGKKHYAKSVPGLPATHWLENAMRDALPIAQERFAEVIQKFDFGKYLVIGG